MMKNKLQLHKCFQHRPLISGILNEHMIYNVLPFYDKLCIHFTNEYTM